MECTTRKYTTSTGIVYRGLTPLEYVTIEEYFCTGEMKFLFLDPILKGDCSNMSPDFGRFFVDIAVNRHKRPKGSHGKSPMPACLMQDRFNALRSIKQGGEARLFTPTGSKVYTVALSYSEAVATLATEFFHAESTIEKMLATATKTRKKYAEAKE